MNRPSFARGAVLTLLLPALAACGDDGTSPDPLTPGEIAGVYAVCQLTFSPEGLPSVSLRDVAFETSNAGVQQPQLRVDPSRQTELVYTPRGGFVSQNVRGTFQIGGTSVVLQFNDSGTTSRGSLLLPAQLPVTFQEMPRALSVMSSALYAVPRADYARLSGQSETNLTEQIQGRLSATLRDVQSGGCA